MTTKRIEVIGVAGLPEIQPGDDLTRLLVGACERDDILIVDDDVVVFTQKVVSKAEGCIVSLSGVEPSELARNFLVSDRQPLVT